MRPYKPMLAALRDAVLKRDNYTCHDCGAIRRDKPPKTKYGAKPITMHVHHIVEYVNGGEHEMNNLISLCPKCHRRRDLEHVIESRRKTEQKKREERARRGLINYTDAAKELGCDYYAILQFIREGKLTILKEPGVLRDKFVSRAEVERLKASSVRAAA